MGCGSSSDTMGIDTGSHSTERHGKVLEPVKINDGRPDKVLKPVKINDDRDDYDPGNYGTDSKGHDDDYVPIITNPYIDAGQGGINIDSSGSAPIDYSGNN